MAKIIKKENLIDGGMYEVSMGGQEFVAWWYENSETFEVCPYGSSHSYCYSYMKYIRKLKYE